MKGGLQEGKGDFVEFMRRPKMKSQSPFKGEGNVRQSEQRDQSVKEKEKKDTKRGGERKERFIDLQGWDLREKDKRGGKTTSGKAEARRNVRRRRMERSPTRRIPEFTIRESARGHNG